MMHIVPPKVCTSYLSFGGLGGDLREERVSYVLYLFEIVARVFALRGAPPGPNMNRNTSDEGVAVTAMPP